MRVYEYELDAMSRLLDHVVDSTETLEIVVHLFRRGKRPVSTRELCRSLQLQPRAVAEALAPLLAAGVIRTMKSADDAGWWFDPDGEWAVSVEVLVDLYELDRGALLALLQHVALEHIQARDKRLAGFVAARRRRKPSASS